jgi:hypothetical protein
LPRCGSILHARLGGSSLLNTCFDHGAVCAWTQQLLAGLRHARQLSPP